MTSEAEAIIAEAVRDIHMSDWPSVQDILVRNITVNVVAALRDAGMLTETRWEYAESEVLNDGTTAFGNPVESFEEAVLRRDAHRVAYPWPEEIGVARRRAPGPWSPIPEGEQE